MATSDQKSIPQVLQELWEMLQAYAKQETVDPLKNLGRYLGFGVGGSLLLGFGVVLVGIGMLRGFQTQTDVFHGAWSWVPYLLVLALLTAVVAFSALQIKKASDRKP